MCIEYNLKSDQIKLYEEFFQFIYDVWISENILIILLTCLLLDKLNVKLKLPLLIMSKEDCGKNIVTDIFTKLIIDDKHSISNF